jgi:Reverse transcriptase (RNA-dependent DNA polymerase)
VDDIIITGSSNSATRTLIQSLSQQFSLKDLGALNFFLSIEVLSVDNALQLNQAKYLQSILQNANMDGAKPCNTHLQLDLQLSKSDGQPLSDPVLYRTIVGMLQYATITRPNLTFVLNKVSQFFA